MLVCKGNENWVKRQSGLVVKKFGLSKSMGTRICIPEGEVGK